MSTTALSIVTAASSFPVTLPEAKAHLKVTHSLEDADIQRMLAQATKWAENETHRIFVDTQVALRFDRFPQKGEAIGIAGDHFEDVYFIPHSTFGRIKHANARDRGIILPGGFVNKVNDIDYTDADGVAQTLTGPTSAVPGTDYQEDLTDDERAQVFPARESTWPSVQSGLINAVQIDYNAGWASEDDVPEDIKAAIRFKLADLYTIRDTHDAGTKSALLRAAEDLLFPYVVQMV